MSRPRKRIAVLTSDGPHHRYLVATLRAAGFDLRAVVIEPWAAQRRRKWDRGKYVDWAWAVYHDWRRRLLGLDAYRRGAFADLPTPMGPEPRTLMVSSVNDRRVLDLLQEVEPELTVVMGTGIIGKRVLGAAGTVLNLHGGHLPDYKGNHCFFFALYNGDFDHVGTSIHFVDPGVDTGDIVEVVVPGLRPSDNAEALYCRAERAAVHRLVTLLDHWERGGRLPRTPQPKHGRQYDIRDRKPQHDLSVWWRRRTGRLAVPYREASAPQPLPGEREDVTP
jgi:methionyl-tRNA formyltransferase